MPVYFEIRKRKNRALNLPRLIMTGTLMLAAGLLLSGLALVSTAENIPLTETPSTNAYRIVVEAGTGDVRSVDDYLNAPGHLPDMPAFDVVVVNQPVVNTGDALALGQQYGAQVVIWRAENQGNVMMTRLTAAPANTFSATWLPDVITLSNPHTDGTTFIPVNFTDAMILGETGHYDQSAKALASMHIMDGITEQLFAGSANFQNGDYAAAIINFNAVVLWSQSNPFGAQARLNRGNVYYATGDKLAALEDYAAVKSGNSALQLAADYNRAVVAEELHLYVEAMDAYNQVMAIDPTYQDVSVRQYTLSVYMQEQIQVCDTLNTENMSELVAAGRRLRCRKEFAAALPLMKQAVAEDGSEYNYGQLGYVELLNGDYPATQAAFQKVLDINPDSYFGHIGRGYAAWMQGNQAQVEVDYRWTENASSYDSWFTLWGYLYEQQGYVYNAGANYWNWMTRPNGPLVVRAEFAGQQAVLDESEGHVYMLDIQAKRGQVVSAVVAGDNPYNQDTLLVLLDEFGNVLGGAGDRSVTPGDWNAHLVRYPIMEDGTYTLAVTQYGVHDNSHVLVTYSAR